jgi:hypothetical protein
LGFRISIFGFWDCPYVDSRFFRIAPHRTAPQFAFLRKKNTRTATPHRNLPFSEKKHALHRTAPQRAQM